MINVPTINQNELVELIKAKLESKAYKSSYSDFSLAPEPTAPAPYVLILGAGFSYGVVPLVDELMKETIGGYYYPDQESSSLERPSSALRKDSARFWAEYNEAAGKKKLSTVELNREGLPDNPGAAYQCLFEYEGAKELFTQPLPAISRPKSYLERLKQLRDDSQVQVPEEQPKGKSNIGERFVKGFLQYVLDPGSEHGYGSTGRSELNAAHIYLASLLEAQQLGRGWTTCAFCRTIFTTNFDTLLQNALQKVNLLYRLTDRPERGLDHSEFQVDEGPIHLVYVHGSILRHNPASTIEELSDLADRNIDAFHRYLESRDVIVIGYSGWNDGLMAALRRCDSNKHKVYWCDVRSHPTPHVAEFLRERAGSDAYVHLGEGGANNLMRTLFETIVPTGFR